MAPHERRKTTKRLARTLGALAIAASMSLVACGTSEVLSGPKAAQITGAHQSVVRDPANPYWSGNKATPETDDAIDQRASRPH